MDVRRPRNRDFNVIEIKLLDFSDDCSGSGNSTVMDASLEGESMAGNKRNILSSSAELNEVLSEDQFEDVKKAEDSSLERRSGPIPGVDGDEHRDQADQHSVDTAEVPEGETEAEEAYFEPYVCRDCVFGYEPHSVLPIGVVALADNTV